MHADVAWLLTTAEPASEPLVRTVAESDSNNDICEVELDQDPPGARNQDLASLPAANMANYRQRMSATLKGRGTFAKTSFLVVGY
jgi:hypothetical protein